MKHILSILLLACISLSSYAQTPYDSFAPETSRPVLELSEIKESKEGSKNTALTDTVVVHDVDVCKWLSVDPLADKYPGISPYAYCGWNPINAIDPDGGDSIYIHDQGQRPYDRGVAGETYTARVTVVQNDKIVGEYRGSTYPNSVSNEDNSTPWNTIMEGSYMFNNASGHSSGKEKGLNIVDDNGVRENPGISSIGDAITMLYTNVHAGKSDRGNYNSRGSHGCITIHPEDAEAFFSHFSWTNKSQTTGTSVGRIFIIR